MSDVKNLMRIVVSSALNELIKSKGGECILPENVAVETPPNSQMGDLGSPMFAFAKSLKTSPQSIASEVLKIINEKQTFDGVSVSSVGEFLAVGPYVNVKLNKGDASSQILKKIYEQKEEYGSFNSEGKKPLASRKVMIEFSSPNTNKPLHLGHLRNDALGESVSRILKKAGAEVFKVNLINNRGIHICKSMLAYKL